jgi:hypothetical protein
MEKDLWGFNTIRGNNGSWRNSKRRRRPSCQSSDQAWGICSCGAHTPNLVYENSETGSRIWRCSRCENLKEDAFDL